MLLSNGASGRGGSKGELEAALAAVKQLGIDVVVMSEFSPESGSSARDLNEE